MASCCIHLAQKKDTHFFKLKKCVSQSFANLLSQSFVEKGSVQDGELKGFVLGLAQHEVEGPDSAFPLNVIAHGIKQTNE